MATITISEVRYVPNSPNMSISWKIESGLASDVVRTTYTTQDKLQARVAVPNGTWGDDEVLAEVRADVAKLSPGEQHTVSLAQQAARIYPAFPEPAVAPAEVPATPAEGAAETAQHGQGGVAAVPTAVPTAVPMAG